MGYVAFDFDGTLAHHEHGDDPDILGDPILAMVLLAKEEAKHNEVRIMTARVCSKLPVEQIRKQTKLIQDWAQIFLGFRPVVTSEKDYEMIKLYDDRAIQVRTNTGQIVE